MTALISSATYQGYPVKEVRWHRSEGLHPDTGYVVIDYSVLKDLKLESPGVPWVGEGGGPDIPGALGIWEWFFIFGKRHVSRTAEKPFTQKPGLQLSGPLILITAADGGGTDAIHYDGVFVLNAQEVSRNLARVLEHKEGEIRIDLGDIRQYYAKFGSIIGRINCRLQNGKYDPRTIKTPARRTLGGSGTAAEHDGVPWSFEEVVRYLFSQLPGGPSVNLTGLKGLPPPEDIDHIGALPASVLQQVLDNYGLIAKLLPNDTYFVARKNARKFLSQGEVATEVGKKEKREHVAYEIKSVSRVDTPWCVMVLGGRRYRQEGMGYVPVFHDVDGRLYMLADIEKVFDGYTIWQVNRQAARSPSKNFQDVLPAPFKRLNVRGADLRRLIGGARAPGGTDEGLSQDELHYRRRAILREEAYRLYAPIALFDNAPKNKKGAPYFSDLDDRTFPFLPMGSIPRFENELSSPVRGERFKGDRGRIVLVPPVVRGAFVDEALYNNREELEKRWDSVLAGLARAGEDHDALIDRLEEKKRTLSQQFLTADREAQAAGFIHSFASESLVRLGGDAGGAVAGETRQSDTPQGRITRELLERAESAKESAKDEAFSLGIDIGTAKRLKVETVKAIEENTKKRAADFAALQVFGGVQGVGQVPYGVIPQSIYSLQPQTGILSFSRLVAIVNHPIVFDSEDLTVLGEGLVSVEFGHQVDYNEVSDFTSFIFKRDGRGGAELAGVSRPTAVKPQVIRDTELVLFEGSSAKPMNLKACIEQAEKKAKPILEGEDSTEGFVTQFSGFVPCVLERGVNSVLYEWGGGASHTFVAVNAPKWSNLARG